MSSTNRKQVTHLPRESSVSSINYSISAPLSIFDAKNKSRAQIETLFHKFNEISGQVDVDLQQNHFNLVNYQRQNEKIKYDPQMMTAKLRKLQNRAEISRAERQIQNREKRKNKRSSHKKPEQKGENYKTIYRKFLQSKNSNYTVDEGSDQESNQNKVKPQGVAYFSQLKRHPVLLQYTLQRINSKDKDKEQQQKNKRKFDNTVMKFKKNNGELSKEYKDLMEDFNKKISQMNDNNPQSIIEERFSKFYSKKSSDKLTKEIKSIPRCSKMIQKQNEIVSEIDDKALSKQNKLKLKSKLNEIISSISKSQKISSFVLPKLNSTYKESNHI